MTPLELVAMVAVASTLALLARAVCPPTTRLAPRVRPYVLALPARERAPSIETVGARTALGRLFLPPLVAILRRAGRTLERRSDAHLERLLWQAGQAEVTPDEYRVRQASRGVVLAAICGGAAAATIRTPVVVVACAGAGFVVGVTGWRRRIEASIESRAARLRQELYTINQLLALHLRTGAGPMQAVQRIVDRGSGAVVEELDAVLGWARSGMSEPDAFRRAAELTPEPTAARTYQLIATGTERGADLATALLALSEDLRDARREQLHKDAVRKRAAMLVPTIAILAPIMLLFIAAPLPSIVLGYR
jgi:Flp pilus assembly protein TadB